MEKETYIELNFYVRNENYEDGEMTCEECRQKEAVLGMAMGCDDVCEGMDLEALENDLDNYHTRKICINIQDIKSLMESPNGRLVVKFPDTETNTLFADSYEEVVYKLRSAINIL